MRGTLARGLLEIEEMLIHKDYYERWAAAAYFPWFVAALAFVFMCTAFLPFEIAFLPAVAACPRRWKAIAAGAVAGSAVGAVFLSMAFRFLGWPLVDMLFPTLGSSEAWSRAVIWISGYGGLALVPLAALPVAQAPALVIAGLLQISPLQVLAAFIAGKSLKYGMEAWGIAKLEMGKRH